MRKNLDDFSIYTHHPCAGASNFIGWFEIKSIVRPINSTQNKKKASLIHSPWNLVEHYINEFIMQFI